MRIAQVSPLYESVPPKCYGGTERVVSYLTEALVQQGHDVTLFASGDSETRARLVAGAPRSLRLDSGCKDPLAHHVVMLESVMAMADQFDIIHYHIDYLHFPLSRRTTVPQVTTLHGRLDMPDLQPMYREFAEMPLVSISDAQRIPLAFARWITTVHHGLPADLYTFQPGGGEYLAFLGRISPEKRVDRAVAIARAVGMPLKIAAKIDTVDQEYFETVIEPLLDCADVEFIGEIGQADKNYFLGGAAAVLFPIDWPEPFGLVMIEALACGTPVVAWRCGSVSEVLEHGVSGFIVDSIEEAVTAVRNVPALSRQACRQAFDRRFTMDRMARDYVGVYGEIVQAGAALRLQPDSRRSTNRGSACLSSLKINSPSSPALPAAASQPAS
jgi:glycosyltransferase involved in cell wall biosynthesis